MTVTSCSLNSNGTPRSPDLNPDERHLEVSQWDSRHRGCAGASNRLDSKIKKRRAEKKDPHLDSYRNVRRAHFKRRSFSPCPRKWPFAASGLCVCVVQGCRGRGEASLLDEHKAKYAALIPVAGRRGPGAALLIFWRMSNRLITSAISIINGKTGVGWAL